MVHPRSKGPHPCRSADVAAPTWHRRVFGGSFAAGRGLASFWYAPWYLYKSSFPLIFISQALLSLSFLSLAISFPVAIPTMRGEWSASASNPSSANGLPLIMCTECEQRRVVRHTSQQPWSRGEIFYCCPRERGGGKCICAPHPSLSRETHGGKTPAKYTWMPRWRWHVGWGALDLGWTT